MKTDPKTTAGRVFVRSLNILLKFARLYGYDHVRTAEQLQIAWRELRTAIPEGSDTGLLLGATGSQLLLDGVPLEGTPAEKQFAQLLSAAGLASVQFTPQIQEDELARFIHAFPTTKTKPSELAEQLKTAIAGTQGIRVNEICFVATDARLKDASMAAQIAAASLGDEQDEFRKMLNDPQKLLELIAAAQGSHSGAGGSNTETGGTSAGSGSTATGNGGGPADGTGEETGYWSGIGSGASGNAGGSGGEAGWGTRVLSGKAGSGNGFGSTLGSGKGPGGTLPGDEEVVRILQALTAFGRMGTSANPAAAVVEFQGQVADLPAPAQDTLRQALAVLAEQVKDQKLDQGLILKLAEHLSIRFAMERFEQGDVKVNAVRQMLDRMNQEIESLRKILGQHEDRMAEAGILVESHREILDRVFWSTVPENAKREVLLSDEAWCIPPKNVQSYVADLIEHGHVAEAISILKNYAKCADNDEPDARRRTAAGLSELAGLYAQADPKLLADALRHVGLRLSIEQDQELQTIVSAAFVRLSQEAATKRCFPAMEQALDLLAGVEGQRPGIAKNLRTKMGIEERVPEFVDEALRARKISAGLTGVLKQLPQTAMEHLSARFNRCQFREDLENIANLANDLGEEALHYLRGTVRGGPVAESVDLVGLLAKLDPQAAEVFLPGRVRDFPRTSQDRIVRQIAASAGHGCCRILLAILDHVDPLVMPLIVDEVGVTGDREALGRLLTIADGDLPAGAAPYLRVKAIESLGRLHVPAAANTLKRIVEARKVFGWLHPQELRIAAMQVLEKLDPEWAAEFLPMSGIEHSDLGLVPLDLPPNSKFVRQRRHARVRLKKNILAVSTNLKQNCRLEIKTASLTGGLAVTNMHLAPGTQVKLRLQLGMRNLQATALMRDYRAQDMSFEIVDMSLEERGKFRKLLLDNLPKPSGTAASEVAAPLAASVPQRS